MRARRQSERPEDRQRDQGRTAGSGGRGGSLLRRLRGFHLYFGEEIDPEVNARVHALARALLSHPLPGVTDVVPSYTSLYVEFDGQKVNERAVRRWAEHRELQSELAPGRTIEIPVRYDGIDLDAIAEQAHISVDEVIERHSAVTYRVYALGFTGGFPFLGEIDPVIRRPRLTVPRPRVDGNTVALADAQGGIYPLPAPGGWNLVGRTLHAIYDPHRERPFLVEPGDLVRFAPSEGQPPDELAPLDLLPAEPRHPVVRVVEPGLVDLVVDGGRFMTGRFGLARSGPADALSAGLANALLGNREDAPVLELNVTGPTLEVLAPVVAAFAGWGVTPVLNGVPLPPFTTFAARKGDVLGFEPVRRGVRGYLALAGGIESGSFYGSASVDVRALIGRPLREGDVLGVVAPKESRSGFTFEPYWRWSEVATVRLLKGPQARSEALAALTGSEFRVEHADRMGLRLGGPPVPGGAGVLSEANPLGAVQVTAGGHPLILLHDRGTVGGYAKPAVVHPADLPLVAQLRPGKRLRFVMATG